MVTSLERRRPVAIDNIPSVRISRFSRHFLATRETIFAGDDRQPAGVVPAAGLVAVVRFLREEQMCVHPPQHITRYWVARATTSGFIKNLEDWRILEPFHILTIYTLTVDVDVKICTLRSA